MKFRFLLALALPLFLAACDDGDESNGEGGEIGGGNASSNAIELMASIQPETLTRTTVNNGWTGLSDNKVAVSLDGVTKGYTIDEQGLLTSADPFLWDDKESVTINAWYPYNGGVKPQTFTVQADQSIAENYEKSDYLEAVDVAITPQNTQVVFVHRVAKIFCTVVSTVESMKNARIVFHNLAGVDEGTSVKATSVNRALLVPQTIPAGTGFIEIQYGTSGSYIHYLETALELKAGYLCLAKVTVTSSGVDVAFSQTASWTADNNEVIDGDTEVNLDNNGGSWNGDSSNNEQANGTTPGMNADNGNGTGWTGDTEQADANSPGTNANNGNGTGWTGDNEQTDANSPGTNVNNGNGTGGWTGNNNETPTVSTSDPN